MSEQMKQAYGLVQRPWGVFYLKNKVTGQQTSLKTSDKNEAQRILQAHNESEIQPHFNLSLARVYMNGADPKLGTRTWQEVMENIVAKKKDETRRRWEITIKDPNFDCIRRLPVCETRAEHFDKAMADGKVSSNVYLRRIHNHALGMDWLLKSVIPRMQWPQPVFKEKRAITAEEHAAILGAEVNAERKVFYQLCRHLGGSQGDLARLKGEDVDWENSTVSFTRKKTGVPVIMRLGSEALNLLKDLPAEGPLFPYLATVRAGDRATEFWSGCRQLNINGVTVHSNRYAWAERALNPERFAMENLGHNSKAVHRAYAKRVLMKLPSLEEYEQKNAEMAKAEIEHLGCPDRTKN
jgi:integrase